jgi:hypothetical protein
MTASPSKELRMATFLARWLAAWARSRRPARRPRRRPQAFDALGAPAAFGSVYAHPEAALADDVAPAPEDERPRGCGWFDSSHDLRAGLQIREHASADAVSHELSLGAWLELHLAESRRRLPA